MFTHSDIITIEEDDDASPLDLALSLQRAINDGLWSLQGSYGRSMMAAIAAGECALGERSYRDYYGSHIPARGDVKPGTKGSIEFVEANMGAEWRAAIEGVK